MRSLLSGLVPGHNSRTVAGTLWGEQHEDHPPAVVLQALGSSMACTDVAELRQVSKQWRSIFGQQVYNVTLPPSYWQHPSAGPSGQYADVLLAFPSARTVRLRVEARHPLVPSRLRDAAQQLAFLPTLRHLVLEGFTQQQQHWAPLAGCLPLLRQQLTALTLRNVTWPSPDQLSALRSLLHLQQLDLECPHLSRLKQEHLQVLSQLPQLQSLRVAFRIAAGTAHTPLCLSTLSTLTALTELRLSFMGLRELSCAASLHPAAVLAALQQLRRLEVLHIPCEDLSTLCKLPQLTHLAFHQPEPLSPAQLTSIAACSTLTSLSLQPVGWQQLGALGRMHGLQQLALQLPAGRMSVRGAREAGRALTALTGLTALREVSLHGPVAVTQEVLLQLGHAWRSLTSLQLCCAFPRGSLGLSAFSRLKQLQLSPFGWDCWSNEPPLLLYPNSLPPTLTSLEVLDVWLAPDAPPSSAVTLPTPGLKHLVLRTLSPCERPLLLPDWGLAQQCEQMEITHSLLMPEHLHLIAALQVYNLVGSTADHGCCADAGDSSSSLHALPAASPDVSSSSKADPGSRSLDVPPADGNSSCSTGFKPGTCSRKDSTGSTSSEDSTVTTCSASSEDCKTGCCSCDVQQVEGVLAAALQHRQAALPGAKWSQQSPATTSSGSSGPDASGGRSPPRRTICYSLAELQRLRPLRLCSSPPQPTGLRYWLMSLSQWKHDLLLRVGSAMGRFDSIQSWPVRGSWGLEGGAWELLMNDEEEEELNWL